MKNITIRQIRYFTALAKHKNFSLAANSVAVSQPALSMQIKELENEVGSQLIDRSTNQISLTALGHDFHKKCTEILENIDELTTLIRIAKRQPLAQLRIGIIPTIAPYLLPNLILEVEKKYPSLSLIFKESQTKNLISEMREGNLDCSILALPISDKGFKSNHLFNENFLLVRNARDKQIKAPTPSELDHSKLLLLEEGHCFREQAISFCRVETDTNTRQHDASSFTTLVHMVSAGLGITLIPEMAQKIETSRKDVLVHNFPDPQPQRSIGMVWRQSSPIEEELNNIYKHWKYYLEANR